jgi:hypothetical protein
MITADSPFEFFFCRWILHSHHAGGVYHYNMTLLIALTKQRVLYN